MFDSLHPLGLLHARPSYSSLSPRVCSNSCLLSQWCHPTILSPATLFSFCLQSFPASASFPMSQLFASGGQSIGASASASVLNIQGWFPLGLTSLISLKSKGLSRVFSNTTGQKLYFSKKIKHAETLKGSWVSTQRLSFQVLHLSFCYNIYPYITLVSDAFQSMILASVPFILVHFNMCVFPLVYSWFLKTLVDSCVRKICVTSERQRENYWNILNEFRIFCCISLGCFIVWASVIFVYWLQ